MIPSKGLQRAVLWSATPHHFPVRRLNPAGLFLLVFVFSAWFALASMAADHATNSPIFANLSFDQLAQIQVTSVSKREERLSDVPAAIHVITDEDLRRSGVTSIPEALRLAPGMEVARVGSSSWAISPRGFVSPFADRMLVVMDGRSVYDPFFSGVYWDAQDYILDDLSRIEVIRGPGGTIWGANAVNGVVNIITKPAAETQGILVNAGGGSLDHAMASFRYGDKLSDATHFRVYGKYDEHGPLPALTGGDTDDQWSGTRGGFRVDWARTEQSQFTFQGDAYDNQNHQITFLPTVVPPYERRLSGDTTARGGNLEGRWTRQFSADSELVVQTYWESTRRDALTYNVSSDTFDIDLNHHFPVGDRNYVTWGLGARLISDRFRDQIPEFKVDPASDTQHLYSAFVQDQIEVVRERLKLTLGSKFERNDFSGWELQPSARLLWQINKANVLWGGVTRAVRAPSRSDNALQIDFKSVPGISPLLFQGRGASAGGQSTIGYELGYRTQLSPQISADVALFYNTYDNVFSLTPGAPIPVAGNLSYLLIPVTSGNNGTAETWGGELAMNWQPDDIWRLQLAYSYLTLHEDVPVGSQTGGDAYYPHQISFNCGVTLGDWQIDGWLRYADELRNASIPSYATADLRVAWRPTRHLEISLVGQNLLDDRHPEYGRALIEHGPLTEVVRSVYAKLALRY